MKFLDNFFKKIPDSVLNAVGLIAGLIAIAQVVPLILNLIVSLIKGTLPKPVIGNIHIALFTMCGLTGWLIFKLVKYRKVQAETREMFSNNFYALLHSYRNALGEIEVADSKNENVAIYINHFAKDTLDSLSDIFCKLTRQKVSACIKIIVPDEDLKYENAKVRTFCRSSNSDERRPKYDNENTYEGIISKNTDFKSIVEPGKCLSCFYQKDLEAYDKQLRSLEGDAQKYENTNIDWKEYYLSTIVAPIRIANKRNPKVPEEQSYTIRGFLCVDSLSKHAFEDSQREYYQHIVKAYAALLYSILDIYKIRVEDIQKSSQQLDENLFEERTEQKGNRSSENTTGPREASAYLNNPKHATMQRKSPRVKESRIIKNANKITSGKNQ